MPPRPAAALLAAVAAAAPAGAADGDAAAYAAFLAAHRRAPPAAPAEYARRAAQLRRNVQHIAELNRRGAEAGEGVSFELNAFGDISPEEWAATVLMPARPPQAAPRRAGAAPPLTTEAPPAAFDWREHAPGSVTSVKDQGTVGGCWAFSTVGNIEGQVFLATQKSVSLSAEHLVDCDDRDCSVFGGWPYNAYEYIIEKGGVPSEEAQPYCSGLNINDYCYPCMANRNTSYCGPPPLFCNQTWNDQRCPKDKWAPAASIRSWRTVSSDESQIAAELVSTGPLSVLLDATRLQFYKKGVWSPKTGGLFSCKADGLDHAVLLVGYGTDAGTDYWVVKNSWGKKWGEDGYFRITRGKGTCGINTQVSTSVV